MAEKAKIGFTLDFGDTKVQLDNILKGLKGVKSGLNKTGSEGESSLNKLNLGLKNVFKNISTMTSGLRTALSAGARMSKSQLDELRSKSKDFEQRLGKIHAKTVVKFSKAEGKKRDALRATLTAQKKAIKEVQKLGKETEKSVSGVKKAFLVLESIATVKLASAMRSLVKEATILAARNEVLGTAMRTVGNNAGITNSELSRSESTIRKLGISINDTRELISRFSQAQLGMENASRLARAAQDLAAGSTLGSSEALRIMTQSILSLLPRQLRQFGVVVNLNQIYQEQSKILGKSVEDLTSLEKRQGLLNKIFEEAAKRAGAYERSMEDAGKIMTTLSSRVIPDTLSMFGDALLPVFTEIVFTVYDLLKALQELDPAWKTIISSIALGITVILSLKSALILLGGTLGFVKAGFVGAATTAAAASTAMAPLIIGIGAAAAALVILTRAFSDSKTAQEEMAEEADNALNLEVTRIKQLKELQKVLEDKALTEKDVANIIRANAGRNRELIPLLNKEGVSRKSVLAIVIKQVEAQQKLVDVKLSERRVAAEANAERLKDEQFVISELIKMEGQLAKAKDTAFILKGRDVRQELEKFTDSLTEQQKAMKNLSKFTFKAFMGDFDDLHKVLRDTGAELKQVEAGLKEDFGLAAKGVVKNASDMNQAFLTLDSRLNKLAAKTGKKYPFQSLIIEQQKFRDDLNKAVLEDNKRDEILLKAKKVFQDRFIVAERKFREQLALIGATDLQKIEIKLKKELQINKGSTVAIKALEKKAASARNSVYLKMWDDRLSVTKKSTDALIEVVRAERDLAIQIAQSESGIIINSEKLGSKSRIEGKIGFSKKSLSILQKAKSKEIQTRINFRNKILSIVKAAQAEELALKETGFMAVAEQLAISFNKGIINEQQFNERSKALATELKDFNKSQIQERIVFLKSSLDEMLAAEVSINQRLKSLTEERLASERSINDALRQLRAQGRTDIQNFNDERVRATKLLSDGERAIREGNFDRVKEISDEIKGIALATSKEVRESSNKDSKVFITADKARIGSINLVKKAGALLQHSFTEQRAEEVKALSKVKIKIMSIKKSLDSLISEKKQIEIEVVGAALEQIRDIQENLDSLEDKTVTVTVITKSIAVGGGSTGVTEGGAEAVAGGPIPASTPGLAEGIVDIQGPGTSLSDSIIAMLSKGESVINSTATRMFRPILELMNTDPVGLQQFLAPKIQAATVGGAISNNKTQFGDIAININGVESKDVANINWRRVVRDDIYPELERLGTRKASI